MSRFAIHAACSVRLTHGGSTGSDAGPTFVQPYACLSPLELLLLWQSYLLWWQASELAKLHLRGCIDAVPELLLLMLTGLPLEALKRERAYNASSLQRLQQGHIAIANSVIVKRAVLPGPHVIAVQKAAQAAHRAGLDYEAVYEVASSAVSTDAAPTDETSVEARIQTAVREQVACLDMDEEKRAKERAVLMAVDVKAFRRAIRSKAPVGAHRKATGRKCSVADSGDAVAHPPYDSLSGRDPILQATLAFDGKTDFSDAVAIAQEYMAVYREYREEEERRKACGAVGAAEHAPAGEATQPERG